MTLTIRSVPDDPGIITWLYVDSASGELLALDDDGHDRMGLVSRAGLRAKLREEGLLDAVPVYADPVDVAAPIL